jgi:hypothetical protein
MFIVNFLDEIKINAIVKLLKSHIEDFKQKVSDTEN